jgi:hypothetical protein
LEKICGKKLSKGLKSAGKSLFAGKSSKKRVGNA